MTAKKILLLPGDGIGPEIVGQTRRISELISEKTDKKFELDEALIGGIAIDKTGNPLPPETIEKAKKSDAILLGAVGGPKWESMDYSIRPERGLLGIRKELNLFANIRPAQVFPALASASTIKEEVISGLDIIIIRELTGDVYFGTPRGVETLPDGQRKGLNTMVYTTNEIKRIAEVAFELARKRSKKVHSIDKANVLECTELWREEVQKLQKEKYPDVELQHMYVDNAAMQLVRNPKQFDVVLTGNIFGDILSDIAAMLTGSLGMLPSASLSTPGNVALYEPIHGSAPDIAGTGKANPIATILSFAMMLRYSFGYNTEAEKIEKAIAMTLEKGYRTPDIAMAKENEVHSKNKLEIVGTTLMTDIIIDFLQDII